MTKPFHFRQVRTKLCKNCKHVSGWQSHCELHNFDLKGTTSYPDNYDPWEAACSVCDQWEGK